MKIFLRSSSAIAALSFALVSCGDSESPSKTPRLTQAPHFSTPIESLNLQSTANDQRILGKWKSSCSKKALDSNGTIQEIDFSKNYMTRNIKVFSDSSCTDPVFNFKIVSSYSAVSNSLVANMQVFTVIFQNYSYADAASRNRSCGYSPWLAGVEYNVTNLNCPQKNEGLNLSGNTSGTKETFPFLIYTNQTQNPASYSMDFDETTLVRALRPDETIDIDPVVSNQSPIFAGKEYIDNESLLKAKFCEVNVAFGIRNCKIPGNLVEAADMYTLVRRFGLGIWNDSNFKDRKDLQTALELGYNRELSRIIKLPSYAAAEKELGDGIAVLKYGHPGLRNVLAVFDVNVLDAQKGLNTLAQVAKEPSFASELQRLNVTSIYFNKYFSYSKDSSGQINYFYWDFNMTASELWAKIVNTKPI